MTFIVIPGRASQRGARGRGPRRIDRTRSLHLGPLPSPRYARLAGDDNSGVTIHLSTNLHCQLAAEARAAHPRECCGLIEGVREGGTVRALALHATRNLNERSDRFEIDPTEQFRLLRALRGTGRAVVGCYHSHPGGRAEPSPRDLAGAGDEGFVWLIRGEDGLAAFVFADGAFAPAALVET